MSNVISAVLLFNQQTNGLICNISSKFSEKSLFSLSNFNIPHITIAQFLADDSQCTDLWNDISKHSSLVETVEFGGINFVPQFGKGRVWIELQILRSDTLSMLHLSVLNSSFAKDNEIHGRINNQFRPHITLGLVEGLSLETSIDFSGYEKLLTTPLKASLAVGINGENFTVNKVAFK